MKRKAKKAKKSHDLELDYTRRQIPRAAAAEFKFEHGLSVVALMIPTVGTVVIGKTGVTNPARCWRYPLNTSMSAAVGMTFQAIMEDLCKQIDDPRKL